MSLSSAPSNLNSRQVHRGGLARSMRRTLSYFAFIPLTVMAITASLIAGYVLQEEVVGQMRSLVKANVSEAQDELIIKQIRLDRITRRPSFESATQILLHQSRSSTFFVLSKNSIEALFAEINGETNSPVFNEYLMFDEKGEILIASQNEWEGLSLSDLALFETLREADGKSLAVFGFGTLYPSQMVFLTVDQYRTSDNVSRATIVGITEPLFITPLLKSLTDLKPDSNAYFVTQDGLYVGIDRHTGEPTPFNSSADQVSRLNDVFANGAELAPATVRYTNSAGIAMLSQAVWLPELSAGIVLEVPFNTISQRLVVLGLSLGAIYLLAWVLVPGVVNYATRRVVQPIESLSAITDRFASGNWEDRAQVQGNDEVGQLATSINEMADQLSGLYTSLRGQVQERTSQIRIAAEVAQGITAAFNLDEMLNNISRLIAERFNFYHAAIFLIESGGRRAVIRAAHGAAAQEMLRQGFAHEVGSASVVGWVAANLKSRVVADVEAEPAHLRNSLLPNTRSEAGVPIMLGGAALGVLNVHGLESNTFDEEIVIILQTLASQLAVAMQYTASTESPQTLSAQVDRLFRVSAEIIKAGTEQDVFSIAARSLREASLPFAFLRVGDSTSAIIELNNPKKKTATAAPALIQSGLRDIAGQMGGPVLIGELALADNLPAGMADLALGLGGQSAAFLPIYSAGRIHAILVLGNQTAQPLTSASVRPYAVLTDLMGTIIEKIGATKEVEARVEELDALSRFNQNVFNGADTSAYCSTLHAQVKRVIGDYSFVVALYNQKTNSISIPYAYEDGRTTSIEPFPLGEGLTSILIRTGRPLMLVEDTERQAIALGAKIQGKPAKSWMGVPLMISDEPIGAIIIQDQEQEHRFTEKDLHFLVELAHQMAGVTYNIRLLDQSRQSAIQLQTAAEIARDISGSLDLDELLQRAVNLIRDRFNFYHASIFLVDLRREYAVIREATGEPGAQLKRMGHKLAVGSKSIVGYVTSQGESLVVNDTTKDATYFANPVLPETRGEAAIPLRVGDRILGALDVQSTQPYAFNEENLRTLQILADQLAVAVVNTELFAETQEHLSQHRLLHHITMSAASGTTLEDALETTVKGLQVTLGGDRVSILLLDSERKYLEVRASVGYAEDGSNIKVPVGAGITGWVASHRKPLRVDDVSKDSRYIQISANTRSELALPLLYRSDVLGVVNVESEQVSAYTENDEEMLGTLSGSLAAIIANARLLDQIRRQADRERLLNEVTSKIHNTTDIQSIMATAASEITKAIGARRAQIKIGGNSNEKPEASGERNPTRTINNA